MNTRRIIFWSSFIIILGLIVWGLVVAMNKPAPGSSLGTPAPLTSEDHIIGSTTAPVVVMEYSDFQCPACAQYYWLTKRLVQEASTTIRVVYRHFPLDNLLPNGSIQHPNAIAAAVASEAASLQGKFWDMHDLLFENQTDWAELKDPTPEFEKYAVTIGLDMTKFKVDLLDKSLEEKVRAQKDEGVRLGINSTPTFFVNGKVIDNPRSYEEFKTIIDTAISGNTP